MRRLDHPRAARRVAEHLADPRHAGDVAAARVVGEARDERRLLVRIGLWTGPDGTVTRARFRATSCAALVAYADAACELLEDGADPRDLVPARIRSAVTDVHPVQRDRADLVARAIARIVNPPTQPPGGTK